MFLRSLTSLALAGILLGGVGCGDSSSKMGSNPKLQGEPMNGKELPAPTFGQKDKDGAKKGKAAGGGASVQ
ncbi:MAG: hypothetical protein EBV06_14665 [Planctomycetia bacterium]|nr:hypothetical protein [Planctomycetia bacterium]